MPDRVVLCIGTKKGLFVAEASKNRRAFDLRGPFGAGVAVNAALVDPRGTPRIYASSCNAFFGMKVLVSKDLGNEFQETKSAPAFPKEDGRALANICRVGSAAAACSPTTRWGSPAWRSRRTASSSWPGAWTTCC